MRKDGSQLCSRKIPYSFSRFLRNDKELTRLESRRYAYPVTPAQGDKEES